MNSLRAIKIVCPIGPNEELFSATICAHSDQCDILRKAELLLRFPSVPPRLASRNVNIVFFFHEKPKVSVIHSLSPEDLQNRGFLHRLLDASVLEQSQQWPPQHFESTPSLDVGSVFEVIEGFDRLTRGAG